MAGIIEQCMLFVPVSNQAALFLPKIVVHLVSLVFSFSPLDNYLSDLNNLTESKEFFSKSWNSLQDE